MSYNYNPHRKRNLYDPKSEKPFKISRSKIDLFIECPRCFYIDRRLGTNRPPGFPFNINSAVDSLLKSEFDIHRANGTIHPLLQRYGLDIIPAPHEKIDEWRANFKGVQYHHEATNLIITGAIDDLWVDYENNHFVVDYKATAKKEPVTDLNQGWHIGYKRQMEIYQWLVRRNGLTVSDTSYFVYCTGDPTAPLFNNRVNFDVHLISYQGNDSWIEQMINKIHQVLCADVMPDFGNRCDYCAYIEARKSLKIN